MATKPTPGGAAGTYGTELNAFLDVSIAADGKVKTEALQTDATAPSANAALANKKYIDDQIAAAVAAIEPFKVKAWGNILGTSVSAGSNISGVTNPSTGTFVVTWTTGFASGSYAVIVTPLHATTHFLWTVTTKGGGATTTIKFENTSFAAANPTSFDIIAIGTQ